MFNFTNPRRALIVRLGIGVVGFCAVFDNAFSASDRTDITSRTFAVDLVSLTPESATATFSFDPDFLAQYGWTVAATSETAAEDEGRVAALDVLPGSEVLIETQRRRFTGGVHARLRTMGGFMLGGAGRVLHVPNPTLRGDTVSGWTIETVVGGIDEPLTLFTLADPLVQFGQSVQHMAIQGSLVLTSDAAAQIGLPELADRVIGSLFVELQLVDTVDYAAPALGNEDAASALAMSTGADVIVGDLHAPSPSRRGVLGNISAFALGTTACSVGDMPIGWFAMTSDSPVITSNIYRLRSNQFEQIGLSWMKYGFSVSSGNLCNPLVPCVPMGAGMLPPGCSDVYSISTNAFQLNLGARSTINPVTGVYDYPLMQTPVSTTIERLLQVHRDDLEPDLNAGARYFVEGHYITPDDAASGNQNNNASYREVSVIENPANTYALIYTAGGATRREMPGVLAWQEADPAVGITYIDVSGDRRFILGFRVIYLGNGQWQYEYALQNLNSDRGGQSFIVPLPDLVTVSNIGFHDVADHSGVPFDTTDWTHTLDAVSVSWATATEVINPDANALRWGSLYNFRFTTDSPPQAGDITLGLFKTGNPASVAAAALVPGSRRFFADSTPPDGAIDARQPSELDGSAITGWDNLNWNCLSAGICAALTFDGFVLTQTGGVGVAPLVIGLVPAAPDVVGVFFKNPINEQAWSTLSTLSSADRVRLGFLPGDVDASGTADAGDVTALAAELTAGLSLAEWSVDINRDNAFDTEDLIRLLDLLQGAGDYDPYFGIALPPIP